MYAALIHMDTRSTGVCCNDTYGHTEHKCLLQWYIWTHGAQVYAAMVHMDTRSTGVCCNDIHGHTEHKCLLQWYIWTHGALGVCCNGTYGHTEHKCLLQWYIWTHGAQVFAAMVHMDTRNTGFEGLRTGRKEEDEDG